MKVLVCSLNLNFAEGIIHEIERRGHEVIYYDLDLNKRRNTIEPKRAIDETMNKMRFSRLMDECDIVYCEFVEGLAYEVAMWKMFNRLTVPLLFRLHRIELYSPLTYQIPWRVVDDLVFIADHVADKWNRFAPQECGRPLRQHICYNGYDSELFHLPESKQYGRNMVVIGSIQWKKDIYGLIENMTTLEGWTLDIRGDPGLQQGEEYMVNCQDCIKNHGLEDKVRFIPNMTRRNFAEALRDYDVIISSSLEEGCHCSIAEGMLSGVYPLLRHWTGVETFFPSENIYENYTDLKHKLEWWAALSAQEKKQASEHYRLYIEKRFDAETQARAFVDILESSYNQAQAGKDKWWQS